jgi:Uma2 family endonuclease
VRIAAFLDALTEGTGLCVSAPVNIGKDKEDARVPDIGVFRADTPRTSAAFLATARLVVEVLSEDEVAGAKLDFYAAWQVEEYLEVDLHRRALRLLTRAAEGWQPVAASGVLPFSVEGDTLVAATHRYRIDWPD